MMRTIPATRLQEGDVIALPFGKTATVASTPTIGRQYVSFKTEHGPARVYRDDEIYLEEVTPTIWNFDTTAEAYDASQCRDEIKDGDVLLVRPEKVAGFLFEAWPVAVSDERGEFQRTTPGFLQAHPNYRAAWDLAAQFSSEFS